MMCIFIPVGCGDVTLKYPVLIHQQNLTKHVDVCVEVIAHNQHLAHYIAMCLYPDYLSLSVEDEPIKPGTPEDIPTQTT